MAKNTHPAPARHPAERPSRLQCAVSTITRSSSHTCAWLVLLLALALYLAGCGAQEDVSPSFEDRIPLALELEAADRVVELEDAATLFGTLTQGKEELAGERVVLQADSYPFDGNYEEIASVETDARGAFEFEVTPDSNTTYRTAAGELSEATSPARRVYVEPRLKLEIEAVGPRTRFTTVFRHPEDRSIQGSNVYSYAAPAAEAEATGELRFIRVDRVEEVRLGLSDSSIQLPLPESEIRYSTCISYAPSAGLGAPNDRCTQSSVPFQG